MTRSHYFFAGGGTGGHIYPALAVAEQIREAEPDAHITFFCSRRPIDSRILSKAGFDFIPLPVRSFSLRPDKLVVFCATLLQSYNLAKERITPFVSRSIVIGSGGFASAPAVFAAGKLNVPVAMLNVDILPGRANKLLAGFAKQIFVQFEDTARHFAKTKAVVSVTGCPLRKGFGHPDRTGVIDELELDENKKTILITGASSGAMNINNAVCALLGNLEEFADDWQIVHLTGKSDYERVSGGYTNAKISHKILDYYDDMPGLLAAADLVVGRAGAVSVAEYAAAGAAAICLPYPYHKDKHQYLNAAKLVEAGAAVVVDDLAGDIERTSKKLCEQLMILMKDDERRGRMARCGQASAKLDAAERIAQAIMRL